MSEISEKKQNSSNEDSKKRSSSGDGGDRRKGKFDRSSDSKSFGGDRRGGGDSRGRGGSRGGDRRRSFDRDGDRDRSFSRDRRDGSRGGDRRSGGGFRDGDRGRSFGGDRRDGFGGGGDRRRSFDREGDRNRSFGGERGDRRGGGGFRGRDGDRSFGGDRRGGGGFRGRDRDRSFDRDRSDRNDKRRKFSDTKGSHSENHKDDSNFSGKISINVPSWISDQKILTKLKEKGHLIYGANAVESVLKNQSREVFKLILTEKSFAKLNEEIAEKYKDKIELTDSSWIDKLLGIKNKHQDFVVHTGDLIEKVPLKDFLKDTEKPMTIFFLDEIQDPQNVGAIIRSARAFGVDAVISTLHNSPGCILSIVRSSAGYSEEINFYRVGSVSGALQLIRDADFEIVCLDSNSEECIDSDVFGKKVCFVLGSEGSGVRPSLQESCDRVVKIPILEGVDSINVAATATVVGYLSFAQKKA